MLSSWSVYRCARRAWHGTSWHAKLQRCIAQHSTTQHYTDWTKNQNLFGSVCEMANTVIPHARLFFVSIRFVNKHWCTMWSLFCVCISNSRRKIWELFSLESSHEYSALSLSTQHQRLMIWSLRFETSEYIIWIENAGDRKHTKNCSNEIEKELWTPFSLCKGIKYVLCLTKKKSKPKCLWIFSTPKQMCVIRFNEEKNRQLFNRSGFYSKNVFIARWTHETFWWIKKSGWKSASFYSKPNRISPQF